MKIRKKFLARIKYMNKGFTLLELLLVLALIAVISSCIMTFFITYVKANRMISTNTDLQYSARKTASFISDKAMQSEGIIYISDIDNSDINLINTTGDIETYTINFIKTNSYFDSFVIYDNKIYYEEIEKYNGKAVINNNNLLSNNIDNIFICTKDGNDYENTKYIEFIINLSKDGEKYSITQSICIRNK